MEYARTHLKHINPEKVSGRFPMDKAGLVVGLGLVFGPTAKSFFRELIDTTWPMSFGFLFNFLALLSLSLSLNDVPRRT